MSNNTNGSNPSNKTFYKDKNSSEVKTNDLKIGTGPFVSKGTLCIFNYTGLLINGDIFDSTEKHGRPFECVVGSKKIIQGMSLGLLGMQVGGLREIHIPSSLAYGERTLGKIPPHSDLIFKVELLEARPRE